MRMIGVLPFVVLTFISWGLYGPLLHHGRAGMNNNSLLQFICVGLAYFAIAVVIPLITLKFRGEKGRWTMRGTIWSLSAGSIGAIGALGVIFALANGGNPVYVMPLVFGLAPVVNTLFSMWMAGTLKEAGKVFLLGILFVALGAAGVMYSKPNTSSVTAIWDLSVMQASLILVSVGVTALCWGAYGPVLHKGQMRMNGSRLRPFLCVGLAYFAIAVVVPLIVMSVSNDAFTSTAPGILWSLGAGAAGAIGAMGIILAFNFGGRPVFVMPLVFGGAPVINTLEFIIQERAYDKLSSLFYASLSLVIFGAVLVLVFAPKSPAASK